MIERIIISGGGTGGHIFPALAIGEAVRRANPASEVRFVGAVGGMEEKLIPPAGFPLDTLRIYGIHRKLTLRGIRRNLKLPFVLIRAYWRAYQLLRRYRPEVVVGMGGYASYPIVRIAALLRIPTAIQEQNALPGLSNRQLAGAVDRIFLGNADAQRYFPPAKCIFTGNPLRATIQPIPRGEACGRFGLDPNMPVVLVMGGSLGTRSLNRTMARNIETLQNANIQLLWQCGKAAYNQFAKLSNTPHGIVVLPFINDMAAAYSAANLVVCRAGAVTLSELQRLRKPAILVPSPNVVGDHQTYNARSMSNQQAAVLMRDEEVLQRLVPLILELIEKPFRLAEMRQVLSELSIPDSTEVMLQELNLLIETRGQPRR